MTKNDPDYELIKELCKPLALETIKIFKSSSEESEIHDKYYQMFLEMFLEKIIEDSLEAPNAIMKYKQQQEYVYINYATVKSLVQESVSNAFSNILSDFSGKRTDYYCDIAIMPDPINKKMC